MRDRVKGLIRDGALKETSQHHKEPYARPGRKTQLLGRLVKTVTEISGFSSTVPFQTTGERSLLSDKLFFYTARTFLYPVGSLQNAATLHLIMFGCIK